LIPVKVPRWKKWLSYLQPQMLEMTGSDLNPELSVLLYKGRFQLVSGEAIYSWDDLYHNFARAFEVLHIEKRSLQDVLILGLGLGSVPFLLEKKHGLKCHYTAVELDEVVVDLAMRYTFSRLESTIDAITADAEIFVEICEDQFDLLIVDIFEDDLTPPQFESEDFLAHCAALLRPGGLLLFNRLYGAHKDQLAADRFMERHFKVVFPEAWSIPTGGNLILCYQREKI
jgi:spermidine synthase